MLGNLARTKNSSKQKGHTCRHVLSKKISFFKLFLFGGSVVGGNKIKGYTYESGQYADE